jgi:hypothetical protein
MGRLSAPDPPPLIAERTDRIFGPCFVTDQRENLPVEVLHSRYLQRTLPPSAASPATEAASLS